MRELKNSKVYFNNPEKIYRSGDILTGHVEINLNSPQTVKNVYISISGKAKVRWTESRTNRSSDIYYNKEQYFEEKIYVVGDETDSKIDLPAGQLVFPFKSLLPDNLPPTFGKNICVGKIIYKVKTTLTRPWKINKYVEEHFIVETSTIPHDPLIKEPQIMKMDKQFGVINKSEPLTVTVKTPQQGFHAGRIIPLTIDVDNQSDTIVKSISVKLKEVTKFHATTKTRTDEKTISKNHITTQIPANSSLFFNHSVTVPTDWVPIDLSNCKIMDVLYVIKVELHTEGLTVNLVGSMPMIPIKL